MVPMHFSGIPNGKEIDMAYGRRRRSTRAAPRSRSRYASRTRSRQAAPRRRRSGVSSGSRTIRLVIQTVSGGGANASGQAASLPMRAMF